VFLPFSPRAKKWEPHALALRSLLRLANSELLDPWKLAPRVGLTVLDDKRCKALLKKTGNHVINDGDRLDWSGGVYPRPLPDGTLLCLLNPSHSYRRNKVTLMEEISHIYLKHLPTRLLVAANDLEVRDYNSVQELEAYGVGAAALMPWGPLFRSIDSGATIEDLAEHYDVTPHLALYRIKITGAYRLYCARFRGERGTRN
jgi:hypothetical protein